MSMKEGEFKENRENKKESELVKLQKKGLK